MNDSIIKIGTCRIDASARIQPGSVIGKRFRKLLDGEETNDQGCTTINNDTYIGYYTLIGSGSSIGANTIVDDFSIIETNVKIGKRSLISYKAHICNYAVIGDDCVIGGLIGERTRVGNNCRIFGQVIHLQHNPLKGWDSDDATEESPIIQSNVFIGFNAMVIGGITIEHDSYICAGSIVTKDVPPKHIVSGKNNIVPYSKWTGRLSKSPFFNTTKENSADE